MVPQNKQIRQRPPCLWTDKRFIFWCSVPDIVGATHVANLNTTNTFFLDAPGARGVLGVLTEYGFRSLADLDEAACLGRSTHGGSGDPTHAELKEKMHPGFDLQ